MDNHNNQMIHTNAKVGTCAMIQFQFDETLTLIQMQYEPNTSYVDDKNKTNIGRNNC
jgi:hypothetical protein